MALSSLLTFAYGFALGVGRIVKRIVDLVLYFGADRVYSIHS